MTWLRLSALVVTLVCGSSAAQSRSLEGSGRITALPGWRYTPNDHFRASASEAGHPSVASPGGPQLTSTFAYAATGNIEVAIDLFAGTERLRLEGASSVTSVSYGALVGFRSFWALGGRGQWVPNLGLGLGPTLVYTSGGLAGGSTERLVTAYAAMGGITWRLSDTLGVSADARVLLARGMVPGIGGHNGGGVWAGLGLSWLFPQEAARAGAVR